MLDSTIKTANKLLKDLLKGYRPDWEEEKETEGTMGYSSVLFVPGFAFGEIAESDYGSLRKLERLRLYNRSCEVEEGFCCPCGAKARKTPARAYLKPASSLRSSLLLLCIF